MYVNHLHGREFFQHRPWCQARRQSPQALFQRDLETIGHEGYKDMGLDAMVELMVDRPDRQIALQFLEGLLNFGQLDVIAPEFGRVFPMYISS